MIAPDGLDIGCVFCPEVHGRGIGGVVILPGHGIGPVLSVVIAGNGQFVGNPECDTHPHFLRNG